MNFYLQSESDGTPDRPSGACSQFVAAQIRYNREAKRAMKRLDTKKGSGCDCGKVHEAGVDSSATKISKAKVLATNDRKLSTYKGFELHAVADADGGGAAYYYAKHRTLGNVGRTESVARLKRQIDKVLAKYPDAPVLVSARAAEEG